MKRDRFLRASLSAAGAVAVPRIALGQTPATVRVATLPLDAGSAVFYAEDQGFFRDVGIVSETQIISNGGAIAAAVASGAVDVGFSNLVSVVIAYKHGVPIALIAPGSLDVVQAPTTILIASHDSNVKSASDLNGKTIATNGLQNILQFSAEAWIDKNGGQSSSVHFVEMPFPDMINALATNRVDAAVVVEPFVTDAKNAGHVLGATDGAVAPRLLIGCWIATRAWAGANAATVARFARAMSRGAEWANAHRKESGAILARHSQLPERTIETMQRVTYPTQFVMAEMQPVIDLTVRYGNVGPAFPASQLIFTP
jgi:NitT/TauT family transport system substrate-binding protein